MKKTNRTKVLIVEDELLVALNLSKELEALGFEVTGLAASEEEAISLAKDTRPHIILMDINLGVGGSGIKAAASIGKEHAIPIIYVTAYSDDKIIKLAGNTKPFGYILKPYNAQEVKAAIKTALVRLKCENKIRESEQRLIVAINAADLDVLEYNDKHQSISLSQGSDKFIGLGFKKDMSKQEFLSLFVESDALSLDHLLSLGNSFNKRARLQHKGSGSSQYVDVFLSNIHYKNNKVQIGAIQDVTYAQQNITNLQISDSVLNQMQESVIVLDSNEIIQKVNPAFCQLVGQSEANITGRGINDFLLRLRNDDISIVAATQQKEVGKRRSEVTLRCKDKTLVHAMLTVGELKDLDDTQKIVLTLTDISRLVEAERSLHKIAFSDALTGFGNRSYLNRLLSDLSKMSRSENVALFYIDLDSFKNVNDSMGHEIGDKVLVEFARRLASVFRDEDHLVRIGGDEFVAIITGSFNKTALRQIGDKILKLFANEFTINEQALLVSCSLGIAFSSLSEFTAEELLKQADSAMYHAKKTGKNTYRFFDADLAQHTQYRIFIEQGLKAAIRDKLVTVYFQPIVDYSGKVVSVEGLCRWYDSKVGFIGPAIFISAAEETQLIQSLGLTIINECMMAKKQLIEAGFGDITVNINFSEKQLQNHSTFDVVNELLAQYGLDASGFVIEITESILHSAASDKTIKLLKNKGFRFALDDFGTGYSSLSRLHDYNVSIVKIDKSFIDLLSSSSKQNLITQSIIELGQRLDYEVVAEGVETIEQCNILRTMGCDSMQGYYFSKPMPIHKLLRYLTMAQ